MRCKIIIVRAVVLIAALFSFATPGFCLCAELSLAEQYDNATVVFTGEVIKRENAEDGRAKVVFRVERHYKGMSADEITIFQPACLYHPTARCWIEDTFVFNPGDKFLIFAGGTVANLVGDSICAGTNLLSNVTKQDLETLDGLASNPKQSSGARK